MLKTPALFTPASEQVDSDLDSTRSPLRLLFKGNELCVTADGTRAEGGERRDDDIVIGALDGQLVVAASIDSGDDVPIGARLAGLRSLFGVMPDDLVAIAGRAFQIVDWNRTHQYCGVCATATERAQHERARRCPACGHTAYPRISPAMMCLVTRGQEILLARNVNFPAGRYSALAGFLEAGEAIEEAIVREVQEEVGVKVTQPKYFSSQSWPFPHSLMIAFTAEYAGGELKPNGHEIAEAGWFSADNLPQLPPRISIARALIEHTLAQIQHR